MVRSCRRFSRFARLPGVEKLESRLLLAVNPGPGDPVRFEWQGRFIEAQRDAWVVQATSAIPTVAEFDLPEAWGARPLGGGFYAISTPDAPVAAVTAWAYRTGAVSMLEPDYAITSAALPSDPAFDQLWGLRNVGQSGGAAGADIRAEAAWNITTGSRAVVVAVIDTGVDYTHPDLAANIWRNPREIPRDGLDNDGNGYVDDLHGWDFANGDADPMDDNSHGTHVAGTIGAVGNNGVGVAGISWQVSIMPLKFMSGAGRGTTSSAIAAINYATMMRRDFGIHVVATNNSWGGGGASLALQSAIAAGGRAGILFVAAAGNSGSDNDAAPAYPANDADPAVIAVAAGDRSNTLAGFSNFGASTVDIVAPGTAIYSTVPGSSYAWYSGTSMAAPHVAGTVALLAAAAPGASAEQLRGAILTGSTPVPAFFGRVATGGLLNAAAALARLGLPTPTSDPTPRPTDGVPSTDAGDTLESASPVAGPSRLSGRIGDGPTLARDVDFYRVTLRAGQTLVADIDARTLPGSSTLDSALRLFNAAGMELARNDDFRDGLDSYLALKVHSSGTYVIAVSAFADRAYAPTIRSMKAGTTGVYELAIGIVDAMAPAPAIHHMHVLGDRDGAPPPDLAFVALAIDAQTATAPRPPRRR